MFDAIAPRYDLVNRIMTFRMDVRWRRRTVASLRPRVAARPCSTWRAAPATCAASCRRSGLRADRRRPVLRDARRGPHRRPARARRRPAPPAPRRRRRRRHLRVRPAQLRQPPPLLRRAGAGRAARRAASPCSRWPSRRTGSCAGATASTSGRWCPSSAGSCPTRPPTATCPDRSPTSPSPTRCWTQLARRRLRGRRAPPAVGRHRPAHHRPTRGSRHVTELVARTRRVDQDLDLLELAGARRRAARAGPGGAGRAGASRRGCRCRASTPRSAAIEVDDQVGVARHGTGGVRRPPVPPRPGERAGDPRGGVGAEPTTARAG